MASAQLRLARARALHGRTTAYSRCCQTKAILRRVTARAAGAATTPGSLPMYKPHVKPAQTRSVKGTVHFLGGAFAGASPQLTYPLLLDALTAAGYTVITTPFPITFQHLDCANEVRKSFEDTLAKLREGGNGYMVPDDRAVHGVGHSMGALLHTLIGSTERQPVASNVLLSFNNLQVAEAIPIPGLLDGLRPGVRSSAELQQALGVTPPSPVQLLEASMQLLPRPLQRPELIPQLVPLLDQVGSVLGEVGGGTVDFQPTPDEARDLISKNYSVPDTLMVRFSDDSIDETPELATLLQARFPSVAQESHGPGPRLLQLPGTHVTPCGADLTWSPEGVFTPGDAVLAATKAALQLDVRRLATHTVEWLDAF